MSEDVWSPTEAADLGETDLGLLDYESGLPMWDALNPLAILVAGTNMMVEAPAIAIVGGFGFWLMSLLPGLFGIPVDVATEVMAANGDVPQEVADLIGAVIGMGVNLFFVPFQLLFWAGTSYAAAHYVRTGEQDMSMLISGKHWWNALKYGAAMFMVMVAVSSVALSPGIGTLVFAGMAAAQVGDPSLGLLLAGVILLALCVIPIIYTQLGLFAGWYYAVLDEDGALSALTDSWTSTGLAARAMILLGLILFGVLNFIGTCMCFVPAALVQGVQITGTAVCWMKYARGKEASQWDFFKRHSLPHFSEESLKL